MGRQRVWSTLNHQLAPAPGVRGKRSKAALLSLNLHLSVNIQLPKSIGEQFHPPWQSFQYSILRFHKSESPFPDLSWCTLLWACLPITFGIYWHHINGHIVLLPWVQPFHFDSNRGKHPPVGKKIVTDLVLLETFGVGWGGGQMKSEDIHNAFPILGWIQGMVFVT